MSESLKLRDYNNIPIDTNETILELKENNLIPLVRILQMHELIDLANQELDKDGIPLNKESKYINKDTVKLANYILEKAINLLNFNVNEPKDIEKEILTITTKISKVLINTGNLLDVMEGNFIGRVASEIKLRHNKHVNISNIRKNNELKNEVERDDLTNLLVKASFNNHLEKAIEDKKENGTNYGIIFIDIDHFKKLNDTYGHVVGDIVLKEISQIFENNFRQDDIICRWGGEEFCILVKKGNIKTYIRKAENLRILIEKNLKDNTNSKGHNVAESITASIGVTNISEEDNISIATDRADKALYQAKNNGRNKIESIKKD